MDAIISVYTLERIGYQSQQTEAYVRKPLLKVGIFFWVTVLNNSTATNLYSFM